MILLLSFAKLESHSHIEGVAGEGHAHVAFARKAREEPVGDKVCEFGGQHSHCCSGRHKEYEEVADFMLDEGIEYGYAEFWDAERIALVRDGAVTMGCSYTMDDLKMYWWITSMKWYPPALPEEMKTAYVVRTERKDSFLAQFTDGEKMELGFENELFSVYVSDRNYVTY